MKIILSLLALFFAACGARESLPESIPSPTLDSALRATLQNFADHGHPITVDYPVIAVERFESPLTLGLCTRSLESDFKYISISQQWLERMDETMLISLLTHEIAHCSYFMKHTDKEQGDVMSPVMMPGGRFTDKAWSEFWLSIALTEAARSI